LNVNEADYIEYLVNSYSEDPVVIDREGISVSEHEAHVPVGSQAFDYGLERHQTIKRQVIKYHVPYSGNRELLRMKPSSFVMWTMEAEVDREEIRFDVVNRSDNAETIKQEANSTIDTLCQQVQNSLSEVNRFNDQIREEASKTVTHRKQELLRHSDLVGGLGVRVRQKEGVSNTFSVPVIKRKPVIEKPKASSEPYSQDPTLDEETYRTILRICHDAGVEMERHPSIYSGKNEETIRDHFLMVLAPHFESATGETFNKTGKTDILIRHEGSNVFVAECKFWRGAQAHGAALDQLLGYLTWRDSKTALIYFIDNKQLDPVLEQMVPKTLEHPCCVRSDGEKTRGWYEFQFRLPSDETRGASLSVLCFHFPPTDGDRES